MESRHGTEAEALWEYHKPGPGQTMQAVIVCIRCPQLFVAGLKDKCPNARILSSAYDSSAGKSEIAGCESLPDQMVFLAGDFCQNYIPVVFAYHCNKRKGLVATKIVVRCLSDIANAKQNQNFLRNMKTMKTVCQYRTPHGLVRIFRKSSSVEYLNRKATDRTRIVPGIMDAVNKDDKFHVVAGGGQSNVIRAFKMLKGEIVREPHLYADHVTVFKCESKNDREYLDKFTNWINVEVIEEYTRRTTVALSVVPIGIEGKIDELSRLLEVSDVSIVGLIGREGVGKTTLSKSVYNCTALKYEKSCYIEDLKCRTFEGVLKELLQRLCGEQLGKDRYVEQKHLDMIKDCFWTQKVLVVLDETTSAGQKSFSWRDIFGLPHIRNRILGIFHALESGSQSKVLVTGRRSAILPMEYLNSSKTVIVPVNGIMDPKVLGEGAKEELDTELLSLDSL